MMEVFGGQIMVRVIAGQSKILEERLQVVFNTPEFPHVIHKMVKFLVDSWEEVEGMDNLKSLLKRKLLEAPTSNKVGNKTVNTAAEVLADIYVCNKTKPVDFPTSETLTTFISFFLHTGMLGSNAVARVKDYTKVLSQLNHERGSIISNALSKANEVNQWDKLYSGERVRIALDMAINWEKDYKYSINLYSYKGNKLSILNHLASGKAITVDVLNLTRTLLFRLNQLNHMDSELVDTCKLLEDINLLPVCSNQSCPKIFNYVVEACAFTYVESTLGKLTEDNKVDFAIALISYINQEGLIQEENLDSLFFLGSNLSSHEELLDKYLASVDVHKLTYSDSEYTGTIISKCIEILLKSVNSEEEI